MKQIQLRLCLLFAILLMAYCQNSDLKSQFNDQFTTDGFLNVLGQDVVRQGLNNWFNLKTSAKDSITGLTAAGGAGVTFAASTDRFGSASSATNFSGGAAGITYSANLGSPLAGGDRFSITSWIKIPNTGALGYIAGAISGCGGNETGYRLGITATGLVQIEVGQSGSPCHTINSSQAISVGSWVFVGISMLNNSGNLSYVIYIGDYGKNNLSSETGNLTNVQPLNTGNMFVINPINSDFEDLMFYTETLSELQMWQNYVTAKQE